MSSASDPDNSAADQLGHSNSPAADANQVKSPHLDISSTQHLSGSAPAGAISHGAGTNDGAAELIVAFLRDYQSYESVIRAVVFLEVYSERLLIDALTNLRDVLDHLIRAAKPDLDVRVVAHHMAEAREHLRRAGVNPLQDAVDDRFQYIKRRLRFYAVWQVLFPDIAPMRDVRKGYREASEKLAQARLMKGDATQLDAALEQLRECLVDLDNLSDSVKPSAASWVVRTILYFGGAIFFMFLGIFVKSWLFP